MSKDTTPVPASTMTRIERVSEAALHALTAKQLARLDVIECSAKEEPIVTVDGEDFLALMAAARMSMDEGTAIRQLCISAGMTEPSSVPDYLRSVFYLLRNTLTRAESAERDLADARRERDEAQSETKAEREATRVTYQCGYVHGKSEAEATLARLRVVISAVSANARERGARRAGDGAWAAKAESALIANEIDAALTEASAETPHRCQCGAPLEWCCAHCAVDAMLTEPAE